jgi:glycosyltransferase involved in cell wall biosynthesis
MGNHRILYFCPQQLWPVNTGARLRNFHLANALGMGCSVTLLQILQPGEAVVAPPAGVNFERVLTVYKDRSYTPGKILRGLWGPTPVTLLNYTSAGVTAYLREILKDGGFQAVQLESIHLFGYLNEIRSAPGKPAVLLDWHNIESELMRRYAEAATDPAKRMVAKRTAALLARTELRALAECDAHTVVSEREKEKLLARAPKALIQVIPNGVDTAAYGAVPQGEGTDLLFVGSMDYHANEEAVIWFAAEIWPRIANDFPALNFVIAGRNPSATVRALASERITVTGTVDDVVPYYQKAFAVIVPLRVGGGTRLKILEAMAAGTPVISTRLGAEGLDVVDGEQILFADTPEQMQAAVNRLRADPSLRLRLSEAGRNLVRERYAWRALGTQLEAVHRGLLDRQ